MADVVPTRLVAAMALAAALAPLNSTMISVALPAIGKTFATSESVLTQALVTSYLLTSIVMQAPGGKLGDVFGHRRALVLGQVAFFAGAALAIASPSTLVLAAARVIMATGGAFIVPAATALLRTELPAARRGRAFGAFGATMALAASVGPIVGGTIAGAFGWRAMFAVTLLLVPATYVLARTPMDDGAPVTRPSITPSARTPPWERMRAFDWQGTLLLAATLLTFVLGAGKRGGGGASPLLVVLSVVLFAAFIAVEKRVAQPVVTLSLFTRPAFVAGAAVIALHNFAMYALLFELPTVMGMVHGASASRTGPMLAALTVPMVVASPIAGRLADAWGARLTLLVGTLVALAGMLGLMASPLALRPPLLASLAALGFGFGLSTPPAQAPAWPARPKNRAAWLPRRPRRCAIWAAFLALSCWAFALRTRPRPTRQARRTPPCSACSSWCSCSPAR